MKKLEIKRLKKQQNVSKKWSQEEIKVLKKLKIAGIYPSTIFSDSSTMKLFFPNRTKVSLMSQFHRI